MPPAESFFQQDAPNLTPLDLDALVLRCTCQGIQAPLVLFVGLYGCQSLSHADRFARRCRACQCNDAPALLLGQAGLPSGSQAIT
jgi:hypothetical protein